jgi:NADH dehydrogenase (ubiquinone) Fe-S protein 3
MLYVDQSLSGAEGGLENGACDALRLVHCVHAPSSFSRDAANLRSISSSLSSSEQLPASSAEASGEGSPAQLTQRREMGYAYARKATNRNDVHRAHNLEFQQTQLTEYLIKTVPKFITMAVQGPAQSSVLYQEPTIYTTPEHLVPLTYFLRDHVNLQFKTMVDITAVDFPERKARFEVVYHLLSPHWNNRIRIKVSVDELTPVPSIMGIYSAANWFEREVWDMFGIFFSGHTDLRRILTGEGALA